MVEHRARTRLFVDAPLAAGTSVGLGHEQAHYLQHVLRLRAGETVALFNGRDGEWTGIIDGLGKGWCSIAVGHPCRPQRPEPDLWLVFAPIKRARIDFIAEKATELGVSALWPMFTRHTAVTRVNAERLRANAVEAAEQSERLSVPQVFEPAPLERILADWPSGRRLLLLDERGDAPPIAEALAMAEPGPWAVMTGPEGGFSRSELDLLRKLPFAVAVGLGPRILRADTAVLAALACWQAVLGDWRDRPIPPIT